MEAYKLTTKVSEQGMISLSSMPNLYNREVELFIVPVTRPIETGQERTRQGKAVAFFNKWVGVAANNVSPEDERYIYLMEKYK
jgi:hypothetical protein